MKTGDVRKMLKSRWHPRSLAQAAVQVADGATKVPESLQGQGHEDLSQPIAGF